MSAKENLRKNLKALREANNLTQQKVADSVGMKRGNYGATEEGRSTPDPDLLVKFSELYCISIDLLLSDKLYENGKDLRQV